MRLSIAYAENLWSSEYWREVRCEDSRADSSVEMSAERVVSWVWIDSDMVVLVFGGVCQEGEIGGGGRVTGEIVGLG